MASTVTVHPELVSLLHLMAEKEHVGAVLVTYRLRYVWDNILGASILQIPTTKNLPLRSLLLLLTSTYYH